MSIATADLPRLARKGTASKPGILHIGPGAFFRAFNAVYTHDAMQVENGDWGIAAVSMRSGTPHAQLAPQGGVYTSVTLSPEGLVPRVISSICDVFPPANPYEVVSFIDDADIRIVSLTITEKGYCYDPVTGGLDLAHPDIQRELEMRQDEIVKTVPGLITCALRRLRDVGKAPFTVLSCDNTPSNGKVARAVVEGFAREIDPDLAHWIAENVAFPSTMVDRITPATTEDDLARLGEETGYYDPAAVFHEPFSQWVIEDDFPQGRPAWDKVGAQMVASVEAHETMKLRCLNGTHSTLAYLGYLAGHETIADVVSNPEFASFCNYLWSNEIVPTVPPPEGQDLAAYTFALMERYRNPSIRHRTWQIAMDGSQKLPQRILGTIRDRMADGVMPEGLCLGVAAWMRYVGGFDEHGNAIDVRDPLAERLRALSDSAEGAEEKVSALLTVEDVFGTDLPRSEPFHNCVTRAYQRLLNDGAAVSVARFPETGP